jgi:hypothetical protein
MQTTERIPRVSRFEKITTDKWRNMPGYPALLFLIFGILEKLGDVDN